MPRLQDAVQAILKEDLQIRFSQTRCTSLQNPRVGILRQVGALSSNPRVDKAHSELGRARLLPRGGVGTEPVARTAAPGFRNAPHEKTRYIVRSS